LLFSDKNGNLLWHFDGELYLELLTEKIKHEFGDL